MWCYHTLTWSVERACPFSFCLELDISYMYINTSYTINSEGKQVVEKSNIDIEDVIFSRQWDALSAVYDSGIWNLLIPIPKSEECVHEQHFQPLDLGLLNRVAKCHGYDGYIRVKIFRGWGKKSERTHNVTKLGLFWNDLHNLC